MYTGLYIEYTHGDVSKNILKPINADTLILNLDNLTQERYESAASSNKRIALAFYVFDDICPSNPHVRSHIETKINQALKYHPDELWIDRLRYPGVWGITADQVGKKHEACEYCKDDDRRFIISQHAQFIRRVVPENVKVGYYAVPFMGKKNDLLIQDYGQDQTDLTTIFDMVSPMLYHRMLGEPADYVAEYVETLSKQTDIPIYPIIQIKDLPNDIMDTLEEDEIRIAFEGAVRKPSSGIQIFCLDHAIEKGKIEIVQKLFGEL